jgi:hypothetical protein
MRRSVLSSLISLLLVATLAAPAGAEEAPERKRPPKPAGVVTSFEDPTLTIEGRDGAAWSGDVSCDVKVVIARRQVRSRGRGHVNIARGSTADLQPGALVLRMKVDADLIQKILIRRAPQEPTTSGEEDAAETAKRVKGERDVTKSEDKGDSGDETEDESTDEECTDADSGDPDDEEKDSDSAEEDGGEEGDAGSDK